jgi:hypothetical protein
VKPYFQKVLTERPRAGGGARIQPAANFKNVDFRDGDDGPLPKLDMGRKRKYGYDAKELTDLINPLRRFLEKNVGRPWDKVWSEICEGIDATSTTGRHLREHVEWMVELGVEKTAKGLRYPSGETVYPWGKYGFLYVDQTGILKHQKAKKPIRKVLEPKVMKIDRRWFSRYKGFWFELFLKEAKGTVYDINERCHYSDGSGYWIQSTLTNRRWFVPSSDPNVSGLKSIYGTEVPMYCWQRRQISGEEIKKLKLPA